MVSVIAMAGFLILPLFVGAVAQRFALTESQIGFLATFIMGGSALSSVAAIFWIRKVNWQWSALLALGAMLCGNVLSLWVTSFPAFVVLQCLVGVGGGAAYSIALTVLSDHPQADRCFGFSVAAQVSFQIVGLLGLPVVVAQYGLEAVLGLLIGLEVVALVLLWWLPASGLVMPTSVEKKRVVSSAVLFALLGCFMFFFNVGVVWTYIERMGADSGFSPAVIGESLAVGVAFGVPGALLASWCGERYGRLLPLAVGALIMVGALLMLVGRIDEKSYLLALALYNFSWNFSLAYQYAAVNAADDSGRSVAAAPAFHALGAAVGPGVAALFVSADNFFAVNVLAIAGVTLSLLLFVFAAIKHPNRKTVAA
nr:MFS transporter [Aestuariicella hydrocarbonica]